MNKELPEKLMCSRHGMQYVSGVVSHPAEARPPRCPIKSELVKVQASLECGCYRWFGCSAAGINSHLRMVLKGLDDRDEVQRAWRDARV